MSEADWTSYRDHLTAFDLDAHSTPEFDAYVATLESRVQREGIFDSDEIEDLRHNELIFDRSYVAELNGQIRSMKAKWMKDDQEETQWPDDFLMVEVTRTEPLAKLVWCNRRAPYNERQEIHNRAKDPHIASC